MTTTVSTPPLGANELATVCGGQQDDIAGMKTVANVATTITGAAGWMFGTPLAGAIATKLGAGPKPYHWHPATKAAVFASGLVAGAASAYGTAKFLYRAIDNAGGH